MEALSTYPASHTQLVLPGPSVCCELGQALHSSRAERGLHFTKAHCEEVLGVLQLVSLDMLQS